MQLRSMRVLSVAFVAIAASCSDAGDAVAPAYEQDTAFHVQDVHFVLPSALDEVALFQPGQAPHGVMRAHAVIGPEGGTLRLFDFEVVVPPGAVSKPRRFEIRLLPEPARERHAVVWLAPHNTQFDVPVTLRLPLESTGSAGLLDTPVLWWDGSAWVPLATQPTADGRIETQTSHFSLYATARRGFTTVGG